MSQDEPAPSAGPVNWESYSHEELYRMLWQDADVADVSQVATEWARHRVALDTHAQVLREQRVALLDSWQGPAAEEAADRLAALAARVEKISELAHAGQQAAQEAADALATARAMMPPPPAQPAVPLDGPALRSFAAPSAASAFPGFAAPPALPALPAAPAFPGFAAPPAPLAFPAAPTFPMAIPTGSPASLPTMPDYATTFSQMGTSPANMGTAFGAVGGAGFSFYFGAATADQQRAEAIRAMQAYESSLMGGSRLIDSARGAIPPASQLTHTSGLAAGSGSSTPGVPWTRLLGGGGGRATVGAPAIGGAAPVAGHGGQLAPGQRVGVLPGAGGVFGVPGGAFTGDTSAARGSAQAAMGSPAGGRVNGGDDEPHENRMPTIDHGLFRVDEATSPAVLGQPTGAHS